jgi:hypothetical protein
MSDSGVREAIFDQVPVELVDDRRRPERSVELVFGDAKERVPR